MPSRMLNKSTNLALRFFAKASVFVMCPIIPVSAQPGAPNRSAQSPSVQFVTVQKDIKLEVLDWGAKGDRWSCWQAWEVQPTISMSSRRNSRIATTCTG